MAVYILGYNACGHNGHLLLLYFVFVFSFLFDDGFLNHCFIILKFLKESIILSTIHLKEANTACVL